MTSVPNSPGIWMSRNTSSGLSVLIASIAAGPFAASPMHSIHSTSSSMWRKPARASGSSSTISVEILAGSFIVRCAQSRHVFDALRHAQCRQQNPPPGALIKFEPRTIAVEPAQAFAQPAQAGARAAVRSSPTSAPAPSSATLISSPASTSDRRNRQARWLDARRGAMTHGILDQSLQRERWQHGRHVPVHRSRAHT